MDAQEIRDMEDQVVGMIRNLRRLCIALTEKGPTGVASLERVIRDARENAAPGELYFTPVWKPASEQKTA
jgi:hypothetical protein